jgi:hypothetical protein
MTGLFTALITACLAITIKGQLIGGYTYRGCFSYISFEGRSFGLMTLQRCAISCAGFEYFAVVQGNLCACRTAIVDVGTELPGSLCTQPCSGNSQQECGSPSTAAVYQRILDAGLIPENPTYHEMGCYTTDVNGQAPLALQLTFYSGLTI